MAQPLPSRANDAAADAATDATLCSLSLRSRLVPPSPSSSSEEINPSASPPTSGCVRLSPPPLPPPPALSSANLRRRAACMLELYHTCWRMRTTVVEVYSMAVYSCVGNVGDTAHPSRLKKSPRGQGRIRALLRSALSSTPASTVACVYRRVLFPLARQAEKEKVCVVLRSLDNHLSGSSTKGGVRLSC